MPLGSPDGKDVGKAVGQIEMDGFIDGYIERTEMLSLSGRNELDYYL